MSGNGGESDGNTTAGDQRDEHGSVTAAATGRSSVLSGPDHRKADNCVGDTNNNNNITTQCAQVDDQTEDDINDSQGSDLYALSTPGSTHSREEEYLEERELQMQYEEEMRVAEWLRERTQAIR